MDAIRNCMPSVNVLKYQPAEPCTSLLQQIHYHLNKY
jgi:hypothetical protein